MDLNDVKLDLNKEKAGIWESIDDETSVLVARMNNPNWNKRFQELTEAYQPSSRRGLATATKIEDAVVTCLAETILLGWKGLKENGVEIPYSVDKAKEILINPKYQPFRKIVVEISDNQAKYRDAGIAADVGNSESSSSGTSNGVNV